MTATEPQPPAPVVPDGPLVMPPDEYAALRTVAQKLGMLPPSPALPEPDTAAMGAVEGKWRERAEAAEGKLAEIARHYRTLAPEDLLRIAGTDEKGAGDDWSFTDPAL